MLLLNVEFERGLDEMWSVFIESLEVGNEVGDVGDVGVSFHTHVLYFD